MPVDITIEPGVALNSIDDDDKLPYNHVISVVDREISIDIPELVQNNVATDTYTLDLDGEWDGISPVVIFGPCESAIEVAYTNGPTTIPADVTKAYGPVDVSVVGYDSTGTVRIVTIAAPKAMNVLESGCYTGTTTEDPDPSLIGQLVAAGDTANKAAEAANTAAGNANEKAQLAVEKAGVADASAANATDAASAANAAANEARQVIAQLPLPDGNVPKRTLGPGAVLTTDDAFSAVPLGLKVYGNTRQNLWVNPSGTSNGVAVTSNEDGSVTVSGTSSGNDSVSTSAFYTLKQGETYTLSIDKETDFSSYGFFVQSYDGSSYTTLGKVVGATKKAKITVPSSSVACRIGVQVADTTEISGTYRVMLNEGDTAEPWCPPGLNSVSELECVFEDDGEPPNVNTIPIDLQGNELCSLPDGTRDVLDVVTVTIAKSVGYIESYAGEDVGEYYIASALTDSGEIAQGAQVAYKLPEQQEVQLAGVQLPALPSPNVTAYASANVEAESEMEYIRDVNVVLGKLESAAQAL